MIIINLKQRIRNWLFSDDIKKYEDRIHKLEDDYDWLKSVTANSVSINNARRESNDVRQEAEKCRKLMNSICDVGVDVEFRDEYHSWAIVCIHGKLDFIKFAPLNHSDIRYVANFLKQFEYSRRVVDSPFACKGMIDDLICHL